MQPKYFIAAITLLPFTGSAENPSFGDWEVDLSAATVMTEAFTENSSGSLFGLVYR